jgi:hypothetical protein
MGESQERWQKAVEPPGVGVWPMPAPTGHSAVGKEPEAAYIAERHCRMVNLRGVPT